MSEAVMLPLPTDRLWDVHDCAAYLRRSTSWVYKAAECGKIPRASGMGWGLRFDPEAIKAWATGKAARPTADVVPIRKQGA